MIELLNLDGYGLRLVYETILNPDTEELTFDSKYTVIDSADVFEYTTEYNNRSEAISRIVTDILNSKRVYDPESLPDDLARAYNALEEKHLGIPKQVAHTFLFYALDDIAATNEYAERRK